MRAATSLLLAGLGFAGDRITKDLIDNKLDTGEKSFFKGKIKLCRAENRGFAMNTLESDKKLVVSVSTVIFVFLLAAYTAVLWNSKLKPLRLGFSFIVAGAAGNVYDRIVRGYVTDFINVSFMKKILFNIADILVVVGSLMALIGECRVE